MGKFVAGNRAAVGHGRPRSTPPDYTAVVVEQCGVAAWRAIVDRCISDATKGDPRARQWLTARLCPDVATVPAINDDAATVAAVAEIVAEFLPDPERQKRFALAVFRGLP